MNNKVYKLAIESGIGGGSVSVIEGRKVFDYRSGRQSASKADYLIKEISELLKSNEIDKTTLTEIVYSDYPGSHTGLKIGASIARGLHLALNAGLKNMNLFECIFKNNSGNTADSLLIVLPLGGSDFVWRIYGAEGAVVSSGRSSVEKSEVESIISYKSAGLKILLPLHLFDNPGRIYKKFGLDKSLETVDLGKNLSGYLVSE